MGVKNNEWPTSGLAVLGSTAFTNLAATILAPWIHYRVTVWQGQFPGIVFPPDYPQQLTQFVITGIALAVGVSHIAAIVGYRALRARGWFAGQDVEQAFTEPRHIIFPSEPAKE